MTTRDRVRYGPPVASRIPTGLKRLTDDLVRDVERLRFGPPVAYVYNPLVYARRVHDLYLKRYGRGRRAVIFLGMNPGPFGMAQTGVPFGEIAAVRDWMGLSAPVDRPAREHPKRPVQGFDCPRSEVSGARFWAWARDRFGTPDRFFDRFYVANYCPLAFLTDTGRNLTPDRLPVAAQAPLFEACDRALRRTVELMEPDHVVGIGRFAEDRARNVCEGLGVAVGRILHPSPANPAANRGWAAAVERDLHALGITV